MHPKPVAKQLIDTATILSDCTAQTCPSSRWFDTQPLPVEQKSHDKPLPAWLTAYLCKDRPPDSGGAAFIYAHCNSGDTFFRQHPNKITASWKTTAPYSFGKRTVEKENTETQ